MSNRKRIDKILVVDIECTCWDREIGTPDLMKSEIIEIGIAEVETEGMTIKRSGSLIVKPTMSSVSPYCTALTGWTQDAVDAGIPLSVACGTLERQYQSRNVPWASWGDYDRKMFERNCGRLQVEYPFGPRHINLKTMAAIIFGWDEEIGMDRALERLGMALEGQHHSGVDDAKNIARIFAKLILGHRKSTTLEHVLRGFSGINLGPVEESLKKK